MFLTMTSCEGKTSDAVVLAIGVGRMRVLSAGSHDVIELRFANAVWIDENESQISLDFLGSLAGASLEFPTAVGDGAGFAPACAS